MSASNNLNNLITDNLDIWTTAIQSKSRTGRGSNKTYELYGIKKLRELILDLAVRGLLVPQDPNDEPASELLKKIVVEKERLIKKGKVKRLRKSPPISEELFLELPNGWNCASLNDVYDVRDGTHDTPKYQNTGFPLITSKNLSSGKLCFDNVKYISEIDHNKIKDRSGVNENDILFAMIGSIGNPVIVDTLEQFSIKNVALFKYYSFEDSSPIFLLRFLQHAEGVFKKESSGAVQSFVSLGKIRNFPILLPPLNEQKRIVAKVDELIALCDQLEQQTDNSIKAHKLLVENLLNALTQAKDHKTFHEAWQRIAKHFDTLFTTEHSIDQLKQTILQLAVMGKLVPQNPNDEPASELLKKIAKEKEKLIKQGKIKKQKPLPEITEEEKPFELPDGWVYNRMDDLCGWITSGSTPPKTEFVEKGVPYLKVYNIREQNIDFNYKPQFVNSEYHSMKLKRSILYPNDVVMNIVGPPLGKIAIIPNTYPEWNCNQAIVIFRPIVKTLSSYIYTFLISGSFLKSIELIGTAGQDNISVTKSRTIVIPIPPVNEQSRIVAKVDELMALCDQMKSQITDSKKIQTKIADTLTQL